MIVRTASAGRNAKRQDTGEWLGPKGKHAVREAQTPTQVIDTTHNSTTRGMGPQCN